MATSFLDGLKSMVTPEFLSGAARNLGESEGAVATGLGAAFPAILAGLVGKAGDSLPSSRSWCAAAIPAKARKGVTRCRISAV